MANINFDTSVTGWTAASGSATAVPSSISKTMFESMLTGLVPQNDFFDRSIVVNASDSYDFRVGSSGNELLHVDNSASAVGVGGSPVAGYELTVLGNAKIQTSSADSSTELWVDDPNGESFVHVSGATFGTIIGQGADGGSLSLKDTGETNETFQVLNAGGTTDFNIKNGTTTIATAMQVDMTTGNVGIGGAAASSIYELLVHGNAQIENNTAGSNGTELSVIDREHAAAVQVVSQGTTGGASIHARTDDSNDAELFLSTDTKTLTASDTLTNGVSYVVRTLGDTTNSQWLAIATSGLSGTVAPEDVFVSNGNPIPTGTTGTVSKAYNASNLTNTGLDTRLRTYSYDTANGHTPVVSEAIIINHETGHIGIGGSPDIGGADDYRLKLHGDLWIDGGGGVGTELYLYDDGSDSGAYSQMYQRSVNGNCLIILQCDAGAVSGYERVNIRNNIDGRFQIVSQDASGAHKQSESDLAAALVLL